MPAKSNQDRNYGYSGGRGKNSSQKYYDTYEERYDSRSDRRRDDDDYYGRRRRGGRGYDEYAHETREDRSTRAWYNRSDDVVSKDGLEFYNFRDVTVELAFPTMEPFKRLLSLAKPDQIGSKGAAIESQKPHAVKQDSISTTPPTPAAPAVVEAKKAPAPAAAPHPPPAPENPKTVPSTQGSSAAVETKPPEKIKSVFPTALFASDVVWTSEESKNTEWSIAPTLLKSSIVTESSAPRTSTGSTASASAAPKSGEATGHIVLKVDCIDSAPASPPSAKPADATHLPPVIPHQPLPIAALTTASTATLSPPQPLLQPQLQAQAQQAQTLQQLQLQQQYQQQLQQIQYQQQLQQAQLQQAQLQQAQLQQASQVVVPQASQYVVQQPQVQQYYVQQPISTTVAAPASTAGVTYAYAPAATATSSYQHVYDASLAQTALAGAAAYPQSAYWQQQQQQQQQAVLAQQQVMGYGVQGAGQSYYVPQTYGQTAAYDYTTAGYYRQ